MPTGLGGNRFWVLDLDRKNGKDGLEALAAYAREHGQDLPESLVATTPSGVGIFIGIARAARYLARSAFSPG